MRMIGQADRAEELRDRFPAFGVNEEGVQVGFFEVR
jgi:hypothetical protein